jgi:hypothetical protein
MRWERAVHHVSTLAQSCADWSGREFGDLRVLELWALGDILGLQRELADITMALAVDLPPADVAWWTLPRGAQHWANATRLSKNPVQAWWRSAQAPIWNHRIVRPALVWDAAQGIRPEVLAALAQGQGETVRTTAPTDDEYAARLRDERQVSLAALRTATEEYERRRWAPGKLEPHADRLFEATHGYLDLPPPDARQV